MAAITVKQGETLFKAGDIRSSLKLITNGTVSVIYAGDSFDIGAGDVPGICEIGSDTYFLTCVAKTDVTLFDYPCPNIGALEPLFRSNPDVSRLFVRSMFKINSLLLRAISKAELKCSDSFRELQHDVARYREICNNSRIVPTEIPTLSTITTYIPDEEPDMWLADYYDGLNRFYGTDSGKLLVKEPAVTAGMIHKGWLDARKSVELINQRFHYQEDVASCYLSPDTGDILSSIDSLIQMLDDGDEKKELIDLLRDRIDKLGKIIDLKDPQYSMKMDIISIDLSNSKPEKKSKNTAEDREILKALTGSLGTILSFAGEQTEQAITFKKNLLAYKGLDDKSSLDDEPMKVRRDLTKSFYELWKPIFYKAAELRPRDIPVPVRMFLYFGFADEGLAGMENAVLMYKLAENMKDTSEYGVYTAFDWLKAIYSGHKMPSRDEFDEDYTTSMNKKKAQHEITDEEYKKLMNDNTAKVEFEMDNMFKAGNKVSFGRISTYCPVFTGDALLKDLNESLVTLTSVTKVFNHIRKIDFTAFYRELLDEKNYEVMGKEPIHLEFLPDVILMPNAGTRGIMWQEIEGRYRNSHGRMIVSIFHMEDLDATLTRLTGDFRWELCKTMQGASWNDVGDPSLTSEYFDYIQFYRKNNYLTADAKEKIKTALQRSRNSYKEMFIRDYITWIMFEGEGSARLNKVVRDILFKYCPFSKEVLAVVGKNPMYTTLINRMKIKASQDYHRLEMIAKKQEQKGAPIPDTLTNEMEFVKLSL